MKRQDLLDRFSHSIIQPKRDAGLRLHLPALEFEPQLDKKEFLEDQPQMSRRTCGLQIGQALTWFGPMHLA